MAEMRTCKSCTTPFVVTPDDLEFYDKVSPVFAGRKYLIPPPTLCRDCRLQRRIAWRNERALYQRTCGLCGKSIVSIFSPDTPCPVSCHSCCWSDRWDASPYGMDLDFSKPFFPQLHELLQHVPQLAIQNDDGVGSVNCQYCQDFAYGKNCYFVIGTWHTQDSFYSNANSSYSRNVCDCINVNHSELAYECMDSQRLYNCGFLQNSENCNDCFFGFDLKGCKNCVGCVGLRQKQFCIFNKPYSETEYKKKIAEYDFSSYQKREDLKEEFKKWSLQFPRKNINMQNCENSLGDHLFNCRNTYGFGLLDSENTVYCDQGDMNNFSYDIFSSGKPLWCYEGMTPDNSYMTHFSWFSWKNKNLLYCFNCHSSAQLFGCAAMHRAEYAILNKKYSREEYEELVPRLIEHMQKNGEWGEFMHVNNSFFAYNETIAQEYFPLTKEEVSARRWRWHTPDLKEYQPQNYRVPDNSNDVPETITQEILACSACGKNFKIIGEELVLYKKMHLPIPRKCSECRHRDRLAKRTPYKLWDRFCAQCATPVKTAYAPDRPEIVYCEKCYLKTVY